MSEKDFKINDIVRVKDTPCPEWMQNMPALPDTLFKVEDIHDGKLTLSVDGSNACFIDDARHFELVETPDQKTAFLSELSELLRKYNASINLGIRTKDRVCGVVLEVNNEGLFYPVKIEDMSNDPAIIYQMPQSNYPLTPDNILDYETE